MYPESEMYIDERRRCESEHHLTDDAPHFFAQRVIAAEVDLLSAGIGGVNWDLGRDVHGEHLILTKDLYSTSYGSKIIQIAHSEAERPHQAEICTSGPERTSNRADAGT